MRRWRQRDDERVVAASPIGIRLVDDVTGRDPVGAVRLRLERDDPAGWAHVESDPVASPGGVLAYPFLGRSAAGDAGPSRTHRVAFEAPHYLALVPPPPGQAADPDAELTFPVPPYGPQTPPAPLPGPPVVIQLLPAPTYPFPPGTLVLRGKVTDQSGSPMARALLEQRSPGSGRALSDSRGEFALPLNLVAGPATLTIIVTRPPHPRKSVPVRVPDDLPKSKSIQLP